MCIAVLAWLMILTILFLQNRPVQVTTPNSKVKYTVTDYTTDITSMAKNVKISLVSVEGNYVGSGFIWDVKERTISIVTSLAVVKDAPSITVTFDSGLRLSSSVVGYDSALGVALLQVDSDFTATILSRTDADQLDEGEYVVAFGGKEKKSTAQSLSFGVCSGLLNEKLSETEVYHTQLIPFDAKVSKAMDGGALCDISGGAIGVILYSYAGDGVHSYAVGINDVKKSMDEIMTDGKVVRGALDIVVSNVNDLTSAQKNERGMVFEVSSGVIVDAVNNVNGLMEDDVIVAVNSQPIKTIGDLRSVLYDVQPKDILTLEVMRGDVKSEVSAEVQ